MTLKIVDFSHDVNLAKYLVLDLNPDIRKFAGILMFEDANNHGKVVHKFGWSSLHICYDNDMPVGYVYEASPPGKKYKASGIFVRADYRRKGIATFMSEQTGISSFLGWKPKAKK